MILQFLLSLSLIAYANAHALMSDPPQRGILGGSSQFTPGLRPIPDAPRDYFGHFPAGSKSTVPGAGKRSQFHAANGRKWTPYQPTKSGFHFRAGVCGDLKGGRDHLRGGKFYFKGFISRTYQQGGVIELRQSVIAHHNGYAELYVCDVAKCGGEISEQCFRKKFCYVLKRAPNPICDEGKSTKCAPIDPKYPTRWYFPCTETVNEEGWDDYLGKFAKFRLPDHLACEHCVVQWFYTSANNCNPPGVVEYFKGPNGPKRWGNCPGQAGAKGGYTEVQKPCGQKSGSAGFPEEYYQCADIRIEPSSKRPSSAPTTRKPTTTTRRPTTRRPTTRRPTTRRPTTRRPTTRRPTTRRPTTTTRRPTTRRPTTRRPTTRRPTTRRPTTRRPATRRPTTRTSTVVSTRPAQPTDPGSGVFKYFNFIADGDVERSFTDSLIIDIRDYNKVAIEAVTSRGVRPVEFYIDGRKVWEEGTGPYFLWGNNGRVPKYFSEERLQEYTNRPFRLVVRWNSESMDAVIQMNR